MAIAPMSRPPPSRHPLLLQRWTVSPFRGAALTEKPPVMSPPMSGPGLPQARRRRPLASPVAGNLAPGRFNRPVGVQ